MTHTALFWAAAKTRKHCYCSSEGLRQPSWSCLNWRTGTFTTTWAGSRHSDMIPIRGAAESQAEKIMIHHTFPVSISFHTTLLHILCPCAYMYKYMQSAWIRSDCAQLVCSCCIILFILTHTLKWMNLNAKINSLKNSDAVCTCLPSHWWPFSQVLTDLLTCASAYLFPSDWLRGVKKWAHKKIIKVAFSWRSINISVTKDKPLSYLFY